jgi:aspartate aminotransferase-like enzyme
MNLRIPGPTPLPENILRAHGQQIDDHRGARSQGMIKRIVTLIKQMAGTQGDVFLSSSSGWGAMEGILVNTVSPGDKVLCLGAGHFGETFGKIAAVFGADVAHQTFRDGGIIEPDAVAATLKTMRNLKAVLMTHNESFTGVIHPLKEIAAAVRANSDALLLVDSVSALGAVETQMDTWGIDAIGSASQKALMGAPGLGVMVVGERAWQAGTQCKNPRYYWDWKIYRDNMANWTTPSTTALTVIYGLAEAADMINKEGLANVYARHERVAAFTRARVQALGLDLFAEPRGYSPTLTAVTMPDGVNGEEVRVQGRAHGVEFGSSWGRLQGKIIRIGHMGMTTEAEIDDAMEALGDVVASLRKKTG